MRDSLNDELLEATLVNATADVNTAGKTLESARASAGRKPQSDRAADAKNAMTTSRPTCTILVMSAATVSKYWTPLSTSFATKSQRGFCIPGACAKHPNLNVLCCCSGPAGEHAGLGNGLQPPPGDRCYIACFATALPANRDQSDSTKPLSKVLQQAELDAPGPELAMK